MNIIFKLLVVVIGFTVVLANAQNIKPGQYDYTATSEMFGMKIPINFKQCVTQKDVDSNNAYVNQKGAEGCTPPVVQRDGGNIAIKYTCTNPKMTGEGRGTISAESFSIQVNVTQHDMGNSVVKTQVAAKRLGDC
jgi:Protein of unknown function (DUF3617)